MAEPKTAPKGARPNPSDEPSELAAPKVRATKKGASARANVRGWLRAIHRDAGYLAVGLTLVYALSGIAVNHIADWDPNFRNFEERHEVATLAGATDDEIGRSARAALAVKEEPREVYRTSETQIDVLFDRRTLHLKKLAASWEIVDEGQKPRFLIRVANWLHLNRGKKAWTYMADAYAGALLFLAISGLFMIKGPKGLVWRGALVAGLGVAIPIIYVTWSGGP